MLEWQLSREPDAATGYYHFGVRTYDPSLRRWLSPDPKFLLNPELDKTLGRQLDLYGYAANNPVRSVDGTGREESRLLHGGSGFFLGFVEGYTPGGVALQSPPGASPVFDHWRIAGNVIGGALAMVQGLATAGGGGALSLGGATTGPGAAVAVPAGGGIAALGLAQAANGAIVAGRAVGQAIAQLSQGSGEGPAKAEEKKEAPKGGAARPGKSFRPSDRQKILEANREKNGGVTKCENCRVETVPGQKSQKGVTPPRNETQLDHMEPKSRGGSGTADNGQVLCRSCNREKWDK